MTYKFPHYIVVEGPIGVGKTSLAKRLAGKLNVELLLEDTTDNPFLPRFYDDPGAYALPTQLHFLFKRIKQVESLWQTDLFRTAQVADFLFDKDALFARATLNDNEYVLYRQIYERLTPQAPAPDLVIYLQAPPDILLQRIRARGVDYELDMDGAYVKKISDAYVNFFYHYDAAPLLIINTANFDLVKGSRNFNALLERIGSLPPGRHYFNPREF